ncbi:hypothetical protein MSLAZ_1334 [Methanosarcina lacustris Z-7289]|uniref:Uncharacterized protein n=1 Tax=Methanosarcina lacustris Z-7289 TaxID=1434111 RepID=A0A0E3WRK3_9EURY|nr:hypothetical protein [Methanosarcina lacustris]AKB74595.1 hypothetical protein MSLAZ_1334 [Methanosarcina lacustris Z-7289]
MSQGKTSQPLTPLYPNTGYPEDIELVLDFMARKRIRRIKYKEGILFRSAVLGLVDSEQKYFQTKCEKH